MPCQQGAGYIVAKRTPYTGNLKTVGKSVVDKNAAREREYLSLVLQTAERRRKNKPVVISLEISTKFLDFTGMRLT
jgi:hypothetical protein